MSGGKPMHRVSVYKDRSVGTWWWVCHVPLCDRQDFVMGGHAVSVRAARRHLATHTRVGFDR